MRNSKKNSKKRKKITPTDEYVYHITPSYVWDKIKMTGGLYGSDTGSSRNTHPLGGSERGYLYVVDHTDWGVWNGVSITITCRDLTDQFVVVGIKKSYLKKNNFKIEQDKFPDYFDEYYRQVYLGDKQIPLNNIHVFGKYYMNPERWDHQDKWVYRSRILGIPPEEVVFKDELSHMVFGNPLVFYHERFDKTERRLRDEQNRMMTIRGARKTPKYV